MSITADRRLSRLPAALAAALSILVVLVAAQAAQASTIHACVKPKSGATRIVGVKAKCRHGEQKLSWNTTGPQGPRGSGGGPGAPGAPGAEGKSGATALFVATTSFAKQAIPAGGAAVMKKVLPPGSFAVAAKTTLVFEAESAKVMGRVLCLLVDRAGTTETGESTTLDASILVAVLGEKGTTEFEAQSVLTLEGSLTSKVTSTLTMSCSAFSTVEAAAVTPEMQALQVSTIA
jgi:hypothetical protein